MKGFITRAIWAGALVQLFAACGADPTVQLSDADATTQEHLTATMPMPMFRTCDNVPFAPVAASGFRHVRNRMFSHLTPHHSAQDVIGLPGDKLDIKAWFGYGVTEHELRDEEVNVTLDDCADWSGLKTWATSDLGAIDVPVQSNYVQLGGFDVMHEVLGDGSSANSRVYGLPKGTHFVVFDIDGTLTINNDQFVDAIAAEVFDRGYTPKAFAGAQALTKAWLDKGYIPLYLTGRPHRVADMTRGWLKTEAFAQGPLHLAEHMSETGSSNDAVGEYKAAFLAELQAKGYTIDYAYGNEPTDVYAYKKAGIAMNHTFTIGVKAGVDGSTAIQGDYTTHMGFVDAQPNATQPFSF